MRAGERVIFHHISKSAGTSMVNLLRRNYPHGGLLEVYDRKGFPAPDPTPQAFAAYLATLAPEQWEQIRCLSGHSVNFAIPVLSDPFQVFTIVRDPVDRVVSLYHYLRGRDGFGERGGLAGEMIREHHWSIVDIYRNFGGASPTEEGEHQLFAAFFNGQTRTLLAPHFPANHIPMTEGEPDAPAALETLEWVISEHYILGSASRYAASVERFAAEFEWTDTTIMRENVTPDRPSLEELPPEMVETIRAYNAVDDELHERALAELADVPDPEPAASDTPGRRRPADRNREVKTLTVKLKAREHALGRAEQALARTERTNARTVEALTRTEQARSDLAARLERHERELGDKVNLHERGLARLRAELARLEGALEEERREHNRLRGASATRDHRLQAVAEELAERDRTLVAQEQALSRARQDNQELHTKLRQLESELARQGADHIRLRSDHARLEGELDEERTELNRLRGASAARDRRRQALVEELAEHLAKREQALAQACQNNQELETKVRRQDGELARVSGDLARVQSGLGQERTEHNRLRGISAARDLRLRAVAGQLAEREQRLVQVGQTNRELTALAERQGQELADLRGLLSRVLRAGRRVAGELGLAISEGSEELPEPGVALLEATLERVQLALSNAAEERQQLGEHLDARHAELVQASDRERRLTASARDLETRLAEVRARAQGHAGAVEALMSERRMMAGHARSLAASRAWRYGHSTSMVLRRMAFRPSKKKRGAAEVLFDMLEAPLQLPAPDQGEQQPRRG